MLKKQKSEQPYVLYVGDETRVVIENENNENPSIFEEVYKQFFNKLAEEMPIFVKKDHTNDSLFDRTINNIYAFVGDRGAGKTSCMLSVASMLKNSESTLLPDNIKKHSFDVIAATDPSFFSNTKNIIDVFLGRLFSKFKQEIEQGTNFERAKKDELLEAFENIKQTLSFMNNNDCFNDDSNIDSLLSLSASAKLKNDIQELINKYLKFIKKNVLVIPIDDIDLHTLHAYEMTEQIRKYLVQENTIVLMALNIEQLEKVVESHYVKHYDKLIEKNGMNLNDVNDMANKYIIKLIPQAHRFVLKSVEDLLEEKFVLKKDNEILKDVTETKLKDIVASYIFKKTRYLFHNSEKNASLIIPRNLREIRQFINFLYSMEDYIDNSIGKYNKERFKDYFLKIWSNNLNIDDQKYVQRLFRKTDAKSINKNVIEILKNKFIYPYREDVPARYRRLYNVNTSEDKTEIDYITDTNNTMANISIGDVFTLVRFCQEKSSNDSDQAFLFFIETFYSMRLYEFYNERTEENLVDDKNEQVSYTSKIDKHNKYKILVAGAYINEKDDHLLKRFSNVKYYQRADYRVISLNALKKALANFVDLETGKINDIEGFNAIELITMMLSRKYDFSTSDESYRAKRDVHYLENFKIDDFAWFSVYSLFVNLTSIKACYERMDIRLYKIADKNRNSILNKLKAKCEKSKPDNKNSFLSCVSIRNINVLNQLWDDILNTPPQKDSLDTLIEILKSFENFNISTYDLNNADLNKHYKINFSFLSVIRCFLEEKKEKFQPIYKATEINTQIKIEEVQKRFTEIKNELSNLEPIRPLSDFTNFIDEKIINLADTLPLNKSYELVNSKLREYFDTPIRTKSTFIKTVDNFEHWLTTLPVID